MIEVNVLWNSYFGLASHSKSNFMGYIFTRKDCLQTLLPHMIQLQCPWAYFLCSLPYSSLTFFFSPFQTFSLSIFSIQNIPDQFWISILKYTLRISQFLWNGIDTFIQLLFIRLEVNFDSKWTFPFITSGSQLQFFWDYLLRNHISKN